MRTATVPSLADLADEARPTADWWVSVARSLDALSERLSIEVAADSAPAGAFAEAVSRDPSLSNPATQVTREGSRLVEQVRGLRRTVAGVAGDGSKTSWVAAQLSSLAQAERAYLRRARSIVWDAHCRDLGGE
jgi:hypothetical protein